jgi:hypothetical protein
MQENPNLVIPSYCEIRPSPIEGVGVFAKELIPAGTRIIQYTGVEMSYKEFKERYGTDWRFTYRRMPWLPQIVSKENKNIINYINDGIYGQEKKVCNVFLKEGWLFSNCDINAGEELLLDYGKKYWANHLFSTSSSASASSSPPSASASQLAPSQ